MARPSKHSPELRERAVRMVFDHTDEHPSQWAVIRSGGRETRLHDRNAASVGPPGGARSRRAARSDDR